jgi:hypothetical protein
MSSKRGYHVSNNQRRLVRAKNNIHPRNVREVSRGKGRNTCLILVFLACVVFYVYAFMVMF